MWIFLNVNLIPQTAFASETDAPAYERFMKKDSNVSKMK